MNHMCLIYSELNKTCEALTFGGAYLEISAENNYHKFLK
jgi:hypothetical protein